MSHYDTFPQPQQSQLQPHYQNIGSSSSAQQFQAPNVDNFNFQPPPMFGYMGNINNMAGPSSYQHEVAFTFNMFPSQPNWFHNPPHNIFGTSFTPPLSAYNPIPSIDCYRPTISSQRLDNASGDDDDKHDDNEVGQPPPPPSDPSTEHRLHERPRRQRRRPQCGTESHK